MTARKIISITSALLLLAGVYVGGPVSAAEESHPRMVGKMGQMMGEKSAGSCPHVMINSADQKLACSSCLTMMKGMEGKAGRNSSIRDESLLPTTEAHVKYHY